MTDGMRREEASTQDLIVAGLLLLMAGVAALTGRSEVTKAKPPPERTVENVKRDVDELTGRSSHGE